TLAAFDGKIKIINSFPSLDTPVCDLQVKEFNKQAVSFGPDVVVVGISKDLPFAQKRFCQMNEIKNITVLSDYKYSSFGINYGLLIKELNLLARSVLIIDKNGIIRYMEIVKELTTPPDYAAALRALESIIRSPQKETNKEVADHCKPCEGGVLPLQRDVVEKQLAKYRGWELIEDKKISKEFKFSGFRDAKFFTDIVAFLAEEEGHHPVITLMYSKVKITLTTHSAGGLTENDFIMARMIDEAAS
ncbi:MAG: thiol peroxidase, partial [Candidatus Omnitrophica bacterium]|nr:thiol peroxidase [Candidatus Omnitrophota bacterium]